MVVSLDDPMKGGGIGGKHTHIRLLRKGLASASVNTDLVTVRETASFRMVRRYPGALRRRLLKTPDERYLSLLGDFARQLNRNLMNTDFDYDVINAQDVPSMKALGEVQSFKRVKLPTVLTLHGYHTKEMVSVGEMTEGSPQEEEMLRNESAAYHEARRIICVDSRIRDYVVVTHGVPRERTTVIPNAIDVTTFQPVGEPEVEEMRVRLRLGKNRNVLLCPRRLVPKNGVDVAIKAMEPILKEFSNALLLVAGDGPQRSRLEGMVGDLGLSDAVKLLGAVPHADVLQYFQAADLVLVPSVRSQDVEEATSLSMLEGMACGKPVVVTDIGGLRETVRHGWNGMIARQGDPEALAGMCLKLLSDRELATSIGRNAAEYVRKNHAHEPHARRVLSEYEKALEE